MENIKFRVMVLGILAAFGIGLIGGYIIVTGGVFNGEINSPEDTSIFVSTANASSNEDFDNATTNLELNMEFQQKGQVIRNVNIPLNAQQTMQVAPFNDNDLSNNDGQLNDNDPPNNNDLLNNNNNDILPKPIAETFFIVPLPVNILEIEHNHKLLLPGNILFCRDGASLVVLDSGNALFLDFGLDVCDMKSYKVHGFVEGDIKEILADDNFSIWEKQLSIWYNQGLDLLSLNVTWTKNVGEGFDYALLKIEEKETERKETESKTQLISRTLKDAGVEIGFESDGYTRVKLNITGNKVDQFLLVDRGFALENDNKGNQNLAFGEAVLVYLPKGESKSFFVRSYCINAGRGVPGKSDKLNMWQNVPGNVQGVIDENYLNGQVASGDGQSEVWKETG